MDDLASTVEAAVARALRASEERADARERELEERLQHRIAALQDAVCASLRAECEQLATLLGTHRHAADARVEELKPQRAAPDAADAFVERGAIFAGPPPPDTKASGAGQTVSGSLKRCDTASGAGLAAGRAACPASTSKSGEVHAAGGNSDASGEPPSRRTSRRVTLANSSISPAEVAELAKCCNRQLSDATCEELNMEAPPANNGDGAVPESLVAATEAARQVKQPQPKDLARRAGGRRRSSITGVVTAAARAAVGAAGAT